MSEHKNTTLKFETGKPVEVVLTANEPQTGQGQYGPWNRYSIKELISGEDCFFASEGLHRQIQEGNFGMGYKMTIEKVHDEKSAKTFFKVTPHGDGSNLTSATIEEAVDMVASSMDVNKPNEVKKLSIEERVAYLEDKIKMLCAKRQKEAGIKTAPEKPTVTGDDLPF